MQSTCENSIRLQWLSPCNIQWRVEECNDWQRVDFRWNYVHIRHMTALQQTHSTAQQQQHKQTSTQQFILCGTQISSSIRINFTSPETRGIVLQDAENRTIVSSFVWTQHWNVTDRRTDRWNPSGYYHAMHCEQCGRDVETVLYKIHHFFSSNQVHGYSTQFLRI